MDAARDLSWQLARLQVLRQEYAEGEARLAALADERSRVRDRLLVLEGGMQVLEEQLAGALEPDLDPAVAPRS